eukprot:358845-Chlamydomonas_euryale.AAC.2
MVLDRKTLPRDRVPDLGMFTYMRRLGHPCKAFFSPTVPRGPTSSDLPVTKLDLATSHVHPPATHRAPPRALTNAGISLQQKGPVGSPLGPPTGGHEIPALFLFHRPWPACLDSRLSRQKSALPRSAPYSADSELISLSFEGLKETCSAGSDHVCHDWHSDAYRCCLHRCLLESVSGCQGVKDT